MIPSSTNLTKLSHRSLVSISGKDSSGLLQGLMMADVMELSHRQSMYSMLLNAQVCVVVMWRLEGGRGGGGGRSSPPWVRGTEQK